tara:strand:- start:1640 stop:1930 length:291 start_codon:yes stop_codon:yes gene_type:complete
MENQVRYKHFTPNKSEQQVCSNILNIINELAPSDSYVQAKVAQTPDGSYNAVISVNASCKDFKSESSGFSLLNSFQKAQQGIMSEMNQWKSHRFLS